MKRMPLWILPLFLVFASVTGFAQSTNAGDIRGTVTDASGALIPGVTVTVVNVDTGVTKTITTNASGVYDTDSIIIGNYTVTFSKDGFQKLVRGPITLPLGFTTVNGELKVGSSTEEVTVTSDVPLLQTETSDQSTTFTAKSMVELPQVTQDWENFTILLPGASGCANLNNGSCSQGTSNPGQVVAVNGNLPYSNIIADGASTTLSHSQNANPATFENVSELQVNTSSFSAQYGIGGIIFNQVSKSGTNQFHGTGYDFIQNDMLTAHPYFSTGPIPFLRYNNFGGSIGGPILKNKMFFYFNYDQIVNHGNNHGYNTLPTDANIGGNFAGMNAIFDPTTQTIAYDALGNPYPVRKSFASENTGALAGVNAIPTAMFDPVAAKFQSAFFPTTANHPSFLTPIIGGQSIGGEGQQNNNYYYNQLVSNPAKRYFGRLDWDVKSNNRITMSVTQGDYTYPGLSSISNCPVGCQNGYVDNNNSQITDVWNVSSTTVNEFRIGYTNQMNYFTDSSLGKGYAAQLGWQFAKLDDFPGFETTGTYPYSWLTPGTNSVYKEHVFDYSDVVTMIRGKHILHFGGELLQYRDNSTAWGNKTAGNMQYSGQYTKQWTTDPAVCGASANGAACTVPDTGFEYADFLLGYINNWSANESPEYGARLKSPQMFVQDDYKLRPNLTINLGLRWQINHGWNEVHGNIVNFDPTITNPATNTPGAAWYASTHTNGRTALEANVYDTFLPRVGFSWAPRPNTTVRGGFGLYAYNWSLDTYGSGMGNAFGASGNYTDPSNGITPAAILAGNGNTIVPVTGGVSSTPLPYTSGSTDPARFNGGGFQNYEQYHTPVPKIYQWNFGMQRSLTTDMVAEVAYVGSHGFNLAYPVDINQVPQSGWSANDSQNRPYPQYQNINTASTRTDAISNYNSLQASITKRMTRGLSLSFNYTWAHFMDDMDSSGWGSRAGQQDYQNAYSAASNYSNSNFDVRHAFKGYAVYQLPFGRGREFLNNNTLLDEIVGGWQLSGTVLLQSGQPFSVYGDQANWSLAGTQFPDRVPGAPLYVSNKGINGWFNPAAFSKPADGTWGNVRRNSLYGPGMNVFNMSAAKSFGLPWEGVRIEFRADAANVFNHKSLGIPGGLNLGSAAGVGQPYTSANTISSVTTGARNLQLMFRVSF
ncbi:MAG TPA: TonB-dependent receptor [Candidatus Sulfotelmatobacter sp.]|nr:TonB-dependent receptor [Candidatus Sulfotelmatobacter sp.]